MLELKEMQFEFLPHAESQDGVGFGIGLEVSVDAEGFSPGGPEYVTRPVMETLVAKTGGMTALLHAAREGHMDVAQALLDGGADIDQASGDGSTPLVLSLINGQFDLAMMLIERGADPNLTTTTDGVSPLFATLQTQWSLRFTLQPQPRAQDNQRTQYREVLSALLDNQLLSIRDLPRLTELATSGSR